MTPADELINNANVLSILLRQCADSLEQAADLRAKLEEMRERLGVES
jgi:hypothetical protein